jgi:simple sugar transport system ATP-binding protein
MEKMTTYQLQLKKITKSFGSFKVLDKVDLNIRKSCIHALLGENGAGKSTVSNIIYGLLEVNSGDIFFDGKKVNIKSPNDARNMGISIVFQHFALFDTLSVTQNIALGINHKGSLKALSKKIKELSIFYSLSVTPDAIIENLSAGEKQRVEIIRCLLQNPKLLIFDEPTSVLTPIEIEKLFETLRKLRDEGRSIIFISHKLNEIKELCDFGTILRKGRLIDESFKIKDLSIHDIAIKMIGEKISAFASRDENVKKTTILTMNETKPFVVKDFKLKSGCITGIAGIAGNGQNILMSFLAGEILGEKNNIIYENEDISLLSSTKRREKGILFVPTERVGRAVVKDMNLQENSLLGTRNSKDFIKNGLIDYDKLNNFSNKIIKEFKVKTQDNLAFASSLSGGNLQKFIVGRSILQKPKVLLIENPTWGVDIQSVIFIRNRLMKLRDEGMAILLVSEDLDEMFSLCDEMAVMNNKTLSKTYDIKDLNMKKVGIMMTDTHKKDK